MLSSVQNNPLNQNAVSKYQHVLRVVSRRSIGTLSSSSPLQKQADQRHNSGLDVITSVSGKSHKYQRHNYLTNATINYSPSIHETSQVFLQKLNNLLLPFIDDADLDVSRICSLLKMSKTNLFMKLKAATGLSISLYVRRLKLIKGKQMLLSTNLTISEIAYQTGFNDPKYFTRVFSAEFGVSPKEMRVRG